jgi:hypothetical protein
MLNYFIIFASRLAQELELAGVRGIMKDVMMEHGRAKN